VHLHSSRPELRPRGAIQNHWTADRATPKGARASAVLRRRLTEVEEAGLPAVVRQPFQDDHRDLPRGLRSYRANRGVERAFWRCPDPLPSSTAATRARKGKWFSSDIDDRLRWATTL